MLLSLSISNIVLIKALSLSFSKGLTVLTGETGAGKSILLDSLGLVLGNRAEFRLVGHGADKGSVVAEFDSSGSEFVNKLLEENDIESENGNILIRRVMSSEGKSKSYINDTPVSLHLLQEVGRKLVEIHGQHEQKGLIEISYHGPILDSFAGNESLLLETKEVHSRWRNSLELYQKEKILADKSREEEDYIRHVLSELNTLDPQFGEEEELADKRRFLQNREKIIDVIKSTKYELEGNSNVIGGLRSASRVLDRAAQNIGDLFDNSINSLDKAAIEMEEVMSDLDKLLNDNESDSNSVEQIEERLFALKDLARKHKVKVDELPAKKKELELQLNLIESSDEKLAELEVKVARNKSDYKKFASELSRKRYEFSRKLEELVESELKPLKMEGSKFKVNIEEFGEEKWLSTGWDKVSFLVKTNAGGKFGPLNKIASGGELSRFMLAMKVVLSDIKSTPTLIFDEIDTGVGGSTADAVGKRLSKLGKKFQVITITHQPQVAAYGDHHMRVEKQVKEETTITSVISLEGKQKKEEVARMLAGASITKEARAAAGKLMGVE